MAQRMRLQNILIAALGAGLLLTAAWGCNRDRASRDEFKALCRGELSPYEEYSPERNADSPEIRGETAEDITTAAVAAEDITMTVATARREPSRSPVKRATSAPPVPIKEGPRYHDRIRINNIGRLSEVFNDSNRTQYACAEKLGIEPIYGLRGAYHTRRPILKIENNSNFEVDSLTHSMPYLVPEAARLLNNIGRNFIDSLRRRGADGYRIKVTSLLRTPHTVKRLRRVNVNATDSSTHQFGTTFDLSYTRFHCLDSTRTINEEDLKNLLAEVLYDLRSQGRCLVKFERKTGCFHVTVCK